MNKDRECDRYGHGKIKSGQNGTQLLYLENRFTE